MSEKILSAKELRAALKADGTLVNPTKGTKRDVSCGVCGKHDARSTSKVNDNCPTHKECAEGDYDTKLKAYDKILTVGSPDFGLRKQFNAQAEFMRAQIKKARAEHEAFTPETPESLRSQQAQVLVETLAMLGVDVGQNPAEDSKGEWPVLTLSEQLRAEIAKLTAKGE